MGSIVSGETTYNFISLKGKPLEPMGISVDTIERSGVDGVDFRKSSKRPKMSVKESFVDCADLAAAVTLSNSYISLKGEVVTVNEDDGTACNNILVNNVEIIKRSQIVSPVGGLVSAGAGTYSVKARWELLPVNPEGLS